MRGKPLDEPLLLREHGLLARVRGLPLRLAELPLALVEVVVAGIGDELAAVDLDDPVHDPVHEIPVVAGHQQRRRTGPEELLEPQDRFDVQVIRRLVHQQHVGFAEEHFRHRDAHLPAAGQRPRVAVDRGVLEAQPVEDLAGARFELVAAAVLVLLLHLAEARENALLVRGPFGRRHRVLERFQLVVEIAEAPASGDRFVEHRAPGHLVDLLAEVAERQLLRNRHVAVIGVLLARDHPEERRLAGPVRPDETDLLSGVQLERRVHEEDLAAVLLGNPGE